MTWSLELGGHSVLIFAYSYKIPIKHTGTGVRALSEAETNSQPLLLSDTSHIGRLLHGLVINTPTEGTEAATSLSVWEEMHQLGHPLHLQPRTQPQACGQGPAAG